jgi:hypothetical protein
MTKSRLELKTDDMGTLQIEWDNVTQVTAPEFFEVEHMNAGCPSARCVPARARARSRWWPTGARTSWSCGRSPGSSW